MAGQSINFPVDVSQVCNALPRPIDESGVILVQSSSTTSASTSTADGGEDSPSTVPSSSSITTHSCKGYVVKIMRALHWLKTSNILYADIHIEDGNITCDDNDNNNNNDNNDENNDDNTTTNEEDEQQQQQQHEGTSPIRKFSS